MKKEQKKTNNIEITETELPEYMGGLLIPFLVSRLAIEAGILLKKAIDWLSTEH